MQAKRETLLRYLRRLAPRLESDHVSDAALLERFIAERDEQAFAALVERHGAMVLRVCRGVLGNADDAEDAFQGTFLVLARKAATIRPRAALAAWLRGVARRVALKARVKRARHFQQARPLMEPPEDRHADPLVELSARELLTVIDEEVQRLPERYRLPVIHCCLAGRSLEETARQLGWTVGSVKGRLERGRARLHERLVRRGLTLSAGLAAVEVSRAAAIAAAVSRLVARTVPGALAFAAQHAATPDISPVAVTLASRVIRTFALTRLALAAVLVLTTSVLAVGLVLHVAIPRQPAARTFDQTLPPLAQVPSPNQSRAPLDQADIPVDVSGRVLSPHGQPLAGAKLYVGYSLPRYVQRFAPLMNQEVDDQSPSYPLRATTGADGRFHFRFTLSELDAHSLDDARPAVMAVAAGYGPQWVEIGAKPSALSLQLVEDYPVTGHLLDQKRRPLLGVKLVVQSIYSAPADALNRYLKGNATDWAPWCWHGPLPGSTEAIRTDAQGRFLCSGLGRDRLVTFALAGLDVPHTLFTVATRPTPDKAFAFQIHGADLDYQTPPQRTIRGTVRDRATGKPVVGVQVVVAAGHATASTGPDGRFEIRDCLKAEGYLIEARPSAEQGYFAEAVCVREQAARGPLTADFRLVHGIALSGKVLDRATGKPPRAALVEYHPLFPNRASDKLTCGPQWPASSATVRRDGSYHLVVLPGPGAVSVKASPRNRYTVATLTGKEWTNFLPKQASAPDEEPWLPIALGARRQGRLVINNYHAVALIQPPDDAQVMVLNLPLHAAHTLSGKVLGPNGRPLTGVEVVGLTTRRDGELLENNSFTVTGLAPRTSRLLFFHSPAKKLGKAVTVRGDAVEPLTVRLEPCGTVRGRLVDSLGRPAPRAQVLLSEDDGPGFVIAKPDAEGRFRLELFPGQNYTWVVRGRLRTDLGPVSVEAGKSKNVGDLVIAETSKHQARDGTRRPIHGN